MKKSKILVILLTLTLVLSAVANLYFVGFVGTTKVNDATKLEMNELISQTQVAADLQIKRIGDSLIYASQQLSTTGISGDQARAVIAALAANSSYIIEAAIQNLNREMLIVEPAAYHVNEGKVIGPQKWLNTNPVGDITPTMTPLIPLILNMSGCSIVAPVFNSDKELIGTVSAVIYPTQLLNDSISPLVANKSYSVTVMTLDGTGIFDTDPDQIGKNLFTDPFYADATSLLTMGHRVVAERSGFGTFSFEADTPVSQQTWCYWTTIYAYGQEWRVAIQH